MDRENNEIKVPRRILNTLLTSLTAGVVPRTGAPYITIGRQDEIGALLSDLEAVKIGASSCRFLIGRYGSGKSFLIQLIRGNALERDFICADADLSPERRLSGSNGGGLATYRELIRNLSSKTSPDGGALPTILSRHFAKLKNDVAQEGIFPNDVRFEKELKKRVYQTVSELEGDVGGFDFAEVLGEYYSAQIHDDDEKKSACLRWLRGEFATKTEAKRALGIQISTIIDDENWYDFIKLHASLAVKLGYSGFVMFIDECVNLYKIPNRISREANYEKLLAIFNDTLQGKAKNLAVVFGGTPQFLEDTRRGLFSYEALRSRLADSRYSDERLKNLSSPVIRLRQLSANELLALVKRLIKLYMQKESLEYAPVTDSEAELFVKQSLSSVGAEELITPREIIRDFLTVLNLLKDNPTLSFSEVLNSKRVEEQSETPLLKEENSGKKITIFDIDI